MNLLSIHVEEHYSVSFFSDSSSDSFKLSVSEVQSFEVNNVLQNALQVLVRSKEVGFCFSQDDPLVIEKFVQLEERDVWKRGLGMV